MEEVKVNLITKSKLLERGWTEKLISSLLPEPILKQNPYYKNASPMKMWEEQTVIEAESSEEFLHYQEISAGRRLAARKAVETKKRETRRRTQEAIQNIRVTVIDKKLLRSNAIEFVRERQWDRGNYDSDPENAPESTIERWMVNYIRHHLTKYDMALEANDGQVGKYDVYPELKDAVLVKIAASYPYLKDECNRQRIRLMEE